MNLANHVRDDGGSELELGYVGNSRRHWLAGKPLENGTEVELRLAGNVWLRGSYEWSGLEARWPGLRVRLDISSAHPHERAVHAVLAIPPHALLRRPAR